MARPSRFFTALGVMGLALLAPPLSAQSGQQPANVLTPAEQAHLNGMRAQLEAEQNKIRADQDKLLREQAALTADELRRRQDGIQARMLQLQASQKQAQAWLDSILAAKASAPPPGQSVRLTIKPPVTEQKAPTVSGTDLTYFSTAGRTYVMRAYREWVLVGSGVGGPPLVYDEVGRSPNWVLIRKQGENSPNWVIDIAKQEFRNGLDKSATPITMSGADVNGNNLIRTTYRGGKIYMRSKDNWVEVASGRGVIGNFREIGRNSGSVTIADDKRRIYLELKVADREIRFGYYGTDATNHLAAMTSVSATYEEPRAVID
jgi:hypothetical protein